MKTPETTTSTPRRYPTNASNASNAPNVAGIAVDEEVTGKHIQISILGQMYTMRIKNGCESGLEAEIHEMGICISGESYEHLACLAEKAIRSYAMHFVKGVSFAAKA